MHIFKGSILSVLITLLLVLIFSFILVNTNVNESVIPIVIIGIVGVSILIGSSIGTIKLEKNGIINGGLIGLIYICSIYVLSSLINSNFQLNKYSIILIIVSIITEMFGGVFGVNI